MNQLVWNTHAFFLSILTELNCASTSIKKKVPSHLKENLNYSLDFALTMKVGRQIALYRGLALSHFFKWEINFLDHNVKEILKNTSHPVDLEYSLVS